MILSGEHSLFVLRMRRAPAQQTSGLGTHRINIIKFVHGHAELGEHFLSFLENGPLFPSPWRCNNDLNVYVAGYSCETLVRIDHAGVFAVPKKTERVSPRFYLRRDFIHTAPLKRPSLRQLDRRAVPDREVDGSVHVLAGIDLNPWMDQCVVDSARSEGFA